MHEFDYLMAVGTIFAFLDAWNIGANDAANSWASSVSSRSVSYIQAMCLGSVLEFAGAVGVGGRVADTIRTKVVDVDAFEKSPALLMLGMVCAITASSLYLTLATKLGMPVSTTHSILGGVLGMGVGALGSGGVVWVGYDDDGSLDIKAGVVQVFLAWVIAPVLAGVAGAITFLITKYSVLLRSNPVMKGLIALPFFCWLTGSLIAMLLVWKGGDYEVNLTDAQLPGVIVAAGAAFALLVTFFFIPWVYRVIIKEDWQLKWYDMFKGPLLLRRGEVPPPPAGYRGRVRDFYEGHLTAEELAEKRARVAGDVESGHGAAGATTTIDADGKVVDVNGSDSGIASETAAVATHEPEPRKPIVGPKPDAPIYSPAFLWWGLKFVFLRGVDVDVVASQKTDKVISGDVDEINSNARHYDNRTEFLYTFLQLLTASTAAFVHGANDVANAVGPYATIYQIWRTGAIPDKSNVPIWILAFGGAGIAIGIWTYGYKIMRNLGNRVTLMSPTRGFSMELGATIAVVVATRLELPVSTTQCITGAIVGVGLCNGTWRAINWRMVAWIYMGWFITVPVAGTLSGCLMGFITYAPNWTSWEG
jgi:sodium-dependent phosphate transporter